MQKIHIKIERKVVNIEDAHFWFTTTIWIVYLKQTAS